MLKYNNVWLVRDKELPGNVWWLIFSALTPVPLFLGSGYECFEDISPLWSHSQVPSCTHSCLVFVHFQSSVTVQRFRQTNKTKNFHSHISCIESSSDLDSCQDNNQWKRVFSQSVIIKEIFAVTLEACLMITLWSPTNFSQETSNISPSQGSQSINTTVVRFPTLPIVSTQKHDMYQSRQYCAHCLPSSSVHGDWWANFV